MAVKEITGFLKYKDDAGDINLFLPITTKDNVDGLDEIENELANAVKVTAQNLTEDQKAQARLNIGAASDGVVPIVTASDAGKFLRVGSDGTWIVEAIQDVSEVGM